MSEYDEEHRQALAEFKKRAIPTALALTAFALVGLGTITAPILHLLGIHETGSFMTTYAFICFVIPFTFIINWLPFFEMESWLKWVARVLVLFIDLIIVLAVLLG